MQDKITTLKETIESLWEKESVEHNDNKSIEEVLALLDCGSIRVAEKINDQWIINEWIKKAILLSFKAKQNKIFKLNDDIQWFDKVEPKFSGWTENDFKQASIRSVPGSVVRKSAYVGSNVILMPSFVNVGAYIDDGTMIDTWATIGSCAQIGKKCHISGGVGIGGVLEPLQANPVIIEDNCFIGARSEIAEGVIVREGSVISMGVFIGKSTKIYDREKDIIFYGEVPPYSVVVPGSLPSGKSNLYAAIIVKTVDEKTRSKVGINELLRS